MYGDNLQVKEIEEFFILDGISFYTIENFLNYQPLLELKNAFKLDRKSSEKII